MNLEDKLKVMDSKLFDKLQVIKGEAEKTLSHVIDLFPDFTPHTIEHKESVVDNYNRFLDEKIINELNKYEIFFLLVATYLHDIGMTKLDELNDLDEMDPDKINSYIREYHHLRAETFITKFPHKTKIEDENQSIIIGRIARGHRNESLEDENIYPDEYTYDDFIINIGLLASFLRIADELDLTHKRIQNHREIYEKLQRQNDKIEWKKHDVIAGLTRSRKDVQLLICSGQTDNPEVYRRIMHTKTKVNNQLREARSLFDDRFNDLKHLFPLEFKPNIKPIGFIPLDVRFSIENEVIIKMLFLTLYPNEAEAIREIIKNCIDAIRKRIFVKKENVNPSITFELTSDKSTLIIMDNGIGMDSDDVKMYLSRLGNTSYSEFQTENTFVSLSELGIGFLAVFMICDSVTIETQKANKPAIEIKIKQLFDYFIIKQIDNKSIGTTIRLHLMEKFRNVKLIQHALDYYALFLDIPIVFKHQNNISYIHNQFAKLSVQGHPTYFDTWLILELSDEFFDAILYFDTSYELGDIQAKLITKKDLDLKTDQKIAFNGIRVEDDSILPSFLNIDSPILNMKGKSLRLDASRNYFIKDETFKIIRKRFEKSVMVALEIKIQSLLQFTRIEKINNIIIRIFEYDKLTDVINTDEDIQHIKDFFSKYYYFQCKKKGKFEYVNEIYLRNEKYEIIIYGKSSDFSKDDISNLRLPDDKIYVFVAEEEYFDTNVRHIFASKKRIPIIGLLFNNKVVRHISSILEFDTLNILDDLVPKRMITVRYRNYETKKILEDFSAGHYTNFDSPRGLFLNCEHKFIRLLINNVSLIDKDTVLKSQVRTFFSILPSSFRMTNDLYNAQKGILINFKKKKLLRDYTEYIITRENFQTEEELRHF